jgi:tRNA threonylcarbamoyladenosine biosynthesis protein TsaE
VSIRLELRTDSPERTRDVGEQLATAFRPGDVVSLTGELGAGKTCLVQGVARGLEVPGRITSPTFLLVKQYEGRLPVVHCDVYRLGRLQDVLDLGDDVMSPDALTLIEWGDAIEALLPPDHLEVEITLVEDVDDADRVLVLTGHGAWADRLAGLDGLAGASATGAEPASTDPQRPGA